MASDVAICNLALAHIGQAARVTAVSPTPDGTVEAMHCARFYPIVRQQLLTMHDWGFATTRAALAPLSVDEDEMPTSWAFAYALPNNCLKPIRVLSPEATDDDEGAPFKREVLADQTGVIYTNQEDAVLVYTYNVTEAGRFDSLFTPLLARLLASYLAGPIIKGKPGLQISSSQLKLFEGEFALATGIDARSRKADTYKNHQPAGIAARA